MRGPESFKGLRTAVISYHTCPLEPPGMGDAGGLNVFVRELAVALAKSGLRTDIFTRRTSELAPSVVIAGPGVRVFHIDAGPSSPLEKEELVRHLPEFTERIAAMATRCSPSYVLVHSHYWMSGLAGVEISRTWSVPHIQTFHTLHAMKAAAGVPESGEFGELRYEAEVRLAHGSDLLTVGSRAERRILTEFYGADPGKLVDLQPGYDPALFWSDGTGKERHKRNLVRLAECPPALALALEDTSHLLVAAGRIQPLKRFDLAIQAVEIMRRRFPRLGKITLAVCGGPSGSAGVAEHARLVKLAEDSSDPASTLILGPLSRESIAALVRAADLVLVTSLSESFGLIALESLAAGTPVVATRTGGIEEIVEDGSTGRLVDEWSPESLAEAAGRILSDRGVWRSMARKARQAVLDRTWDNVSSRALSIYGCLLGLESESREVELTESLPQLRGPAQCCGCH